MHRTGLLPCPLVGAIVAALMISCAPRGQGARTPATATIEAESRLATRLAVALAEACPVATASDEKAKDACASKLASLRVLEQHMDEPFLWGDESAAPGRLEDGKTTRFNPLVWRKLYLALEMFTGEHSIERLGDRTIVRLKTQFRNELDPGEYPYPFWHSAAKWESYQKSTETLFVIEGDRIRGALRSTRHDSSRSSVPHTFNGSFIGDGKDGEAPAVALYARLFSRSNPHVAALDRAFRAFEAGARPYNCVACHSPDNTAGQRQLEMLCYPNQALTSRHSIVRAIEARQMPPSQTSGHPAGISDDAERQRLLDLARAFEAAAESALTFEEAPAR